MAKKKPTKEAKLALARRHLERVQAAWDPPDWDDLSLYGFYCLEAAVEAAALHVGKHTTTMHAQKVEVATDLQNNHGLPDVDGLLVDLNMARKASAYGDVDAPELDAEDVVSQIEAYVGAVEQLISQ